MEDDEWITGWKPYRGKKPTATLPHRVYEIIFPQPDGTDDRYYGITRKPTAQRLHGHASDITETGWRIQDGHPYTARTIHEASDQDEARRIERYRITSGNPSGGRLLNKTHNPQGRKKRAVAEPPPSG